MFGSKDAPQHQLLAEAKPGTSTLVPVHGHSGTQFACLALYGVDTLRFLKFSDRDIGVIRTILQHNWDRGIKSEGPYSDAYEFRVKGGPWNGSGNGPDAVPALTLMKGLLKGLYEIGWILMSSTDISREAMDKDTLLFRKQRDPPPRAAWMAISFKETDKLRILGASQEFLSDFSTLLKSMELLKSEVRKDAGLRQDRYEFKMHGHPWFHVGEESVKARMLILGVLELLERHGWSVYSSIAHTSGPITHTSKGETDAWYCFKLEDWTTGSPVIHR